MDPQKKKKIIIVAIIVGVVIILALAIGLSLGLRKSSTKQPSSQQSSSQQQPSSQQPSSQQPSSQQPSSQQPSSQQPSSQQPSFQQPSFQQPSFQQPSFQQPSFQQPSFQQPSFQQPSSQQPSYQNQLPSYVPTVYGKYQQPSQTTNQITGQPISQPTDQITNQPIRQTISQQTGQTTSQPATQTSQNEIDMWVSVHNATRASVGLGPISWNENLAKGAKQWADGCVFEHSGSAIRNYNGVTLGENLASGSPSSYYDGINGMKNLYGGWDAEKNDYKYPSPVGHDTGGKQTGHYTQIVYRPLKEIGCACSTSCSDGSKLCVCRYNSIQMSGNPPY
ncbi:hypothetical protein Indivirus_5_56 [Indivirus ILV1]|uniref:SCP domain-containing protein n=1 Tax=Indivirus ILV1 TaxID=1977633 RepID=A0A1V0SDZ2_9VIRU|nr:hypothetical protein Indivirus_5_56 [Indivirus ILV1]